jgi:O-antigen ligase/Tfp pilus assembly protein PilF
MKNFQRIIFILFAVLLFFVPLVLWPFTSEVFEFNKIILVYILTTLITGTWIVEMIVEKKFIFRRTILDIPLLVFIGSQLISTIFSIDPLTSLLGYYSRFNGGLLSIICYSLLYWALVSHIDGKRAIKLIYVALTSAVLVSIYGVLEHFGIDKNIWVQDVQSRIFSTLGQPNWLSAWLVALMPVTWSFILDGKVKGYKFWLNLALSVLLFWTMIFTKSRSGYLGFTFAFIIFWAFTTWQKRREIKKLLIPFAVISAAIVMICLISGTGWTPSLSQLLRRQSTINNQLSTTASGATALETGGTESGTIRRIVWKGALQVWLHYPIIGSGVETFAYSYYLYRPAEHNVTSEWDFIYNKAHNEYLNMAANSGSFGLIAYLTLIGFSVYIFIQEARIMKHESGNKPNDSLFLIHYSLLAGYTSLLVTNFFGFSVVPTQILFFLFPAIAVAITESRIRNQESGKEKTTQIQKVAIILTIILASYFMIQISRYWYADTLYALGKGYNSKGRPDSATKYLTQAITLEPKQALYYGELANSYANLALAFNQQKEPDQTTQIGNMAIAENDKVISLSPANVNLKRSRFGIFIMLSTVNPNYLADARDTLLSAILQAPTDAKLYYNLGLTYARTGQTDLALTTLKKTIDLKANYKEARLAYAILLIAKKQNVEAKTQLEYILTKIDPNNSLAKQTLESIK